MMNKAMLIGHVGRDPEIRQLNNGDDVANLSLATSERWKDKNTGEQHEKTEWHRVVIFGGVVAVVRDYVQKGSRIMVEGKIQTRKWQDKSGSDHYSTEIVLSGFGSKLLLLDRKGDGGRQEPSQPHPPSNDLDDDIPF